MALMDAGVKLRKPVAGMATPTHLQLGKTNEFALRSSSGAPVMGLISKGDKWAVLSDILGDEDHLGDMDFCRRP